jgi:hypothetical protein
VRPALDTGNDIAVYRFDQGKITPERFVKIVPQAVGTDKFIAKGLFKLGRGQAIPYPAGIAVVARAGHDELLVANNLSDNVVLLDVNRAVLNEEDRAQRHILVEHQLIALE